MASVGSATTSQPNGRPINVCSADSNTVGGLPSSASPGRVGASALTGTRRPGQAAQTSRSSSVIMFSPMAAPRAPHGNSISTAAAAPGPGWPAGSALPTAPSGSGGVLSAGAASTAGDSGPALVM